MTKVQAIFTSAIDFIGKDKVSGLLASLGYTGTPTAALCTEVLNREGKKFSVPFGKLMLNAAKKPETKAKLLKAAKLAKASGKTDGMTDEEKSEAGLKWFSAIASLFATGIENVDDIINATNGTNQTLANAAYLEALRKQEEAQQKQTLYWILGGIGILLVIVVFVIALSKRS